MLHVQNDSSASVQAEAEMAEAENIETIPSATSLFFLQDGAVVLGAPWA